MKILFSIVILAYNGEKTINGLLRKIQIISKDHSTETIVIDSESKDKTLKIVAAYKEGIQNLRVIKIKKKDFDHGKTRNNAVKIAQGKYICFFSQDAIPRGDNILKYYLEDFSQDNKVMAVFGKHIPYDDTPFIQKLDVLCQWEKIDKYADNKGILIQILSNPFIPYAEQNKALWYALSDTASCYKRSFLRSHPFPVTNYGEDLLIGKEIIEKGYSKIYDRRCSVIHSHKFNIHQYYERVREDLILKRRILRLKERISIYWRFKNILSLDESVLLKGFHIIQMGFYYLIKSIILIDIRLNRRDKD